MNSQDLQTQKPTQILNTREFILEDRLTSEQISQLKTIGQIINQFLEKNKGKIITLLTSGGTSVPLEKNAVRFIENFSTGLRGSQLAQVILQQDMPLIYFYRQKSFLPYQHGITINHAILSGSQEEIQQLLAAREKLKAKRDKILFIPFNSIYMYLNGILQIKKFLPQKSIIILCAAVSDFIPKDVPTHKITTSEELSLYLGNSPKILGNMTSQKLLCVSFKLETDPQKLGDRINFALSKYQIDMVIGNLLGNKKWVKIQYNNQRFPNKQSTEHHENVEYHIWNEIRQAHTTLFEKQI